MGGGQIYNAALRSPAAKRVLLTSIQREYECDVFFGLDLGTGKGSADGWTRRSDAELEAWTGEKVEEGGQEEAGTRYDFQMWEKGS